MPQLERPDSEFEGVTEAMTSLVASIVILMIPVASICAGFMMESIGRVNTLMIATFPYVAGWIMIATAPNIYWILGGRFLHGISVGKTLVLNKVAIAHCSIIFILAVGSSPAIVYVTEVASPQLRGSLISVGQTLACVGNLIAYTKGAYLHWRLSAWIYVIFSIIPGILLKFIPESPIWLGEHSKMQQI